MRARVLIPEGVARKDESEEPDPYTAVRPTLYGLPFRRSSSTVRGEFPGEDGGGALGEANMRLGFGCAVSVRAASMRRRVAAARRWSGDISRRSSAPSSSMVAPRLVTNDARFCAEFNFTSGISWTNNREMGAGSSSAASAAYARSKPDIDAALARLLDPDPTPSSDPTWCASIEPIEPPPSSRRNEQISHVTAYASVIAHPTDP